MFIQVPYTGEVVAFGTGQATLALADAPYGTYTFNLQLRVADLWNPIVGSAVTFDIYVGGSLARHDEGRITGGWYSIFGIWRPDNFVLFPEVKIKVEVASSTLTPLADGDNKLNPDYREFGPDKRTKIIDWSKVKKTNLKVKIMDLSDQPVADYPFRIKALVREESGGHDHTSERPNGRFVTAYEETLAVLDDRSDFEGKAKYTYLCSGIGGVDSVFVRAIKETDTASVTIDLKIANLTELKPSERYRLVGSFGESGVSSRHISNHYGTSNLVQKLQALADSVHADSSYILRINDISLLLGGPFDIKNNWDTPHQTHREGVCADIDDIDASKKILDKEYFERIVTSKPFSGRFLDEKTHYHVTFK
jgi:hypothetical protein